jgi:iron complex transport system substrate-binding protein
MKSTILRLLPVIALGLALVALGVAHSPLPSSSSSLPVTMTATRPAVAPRRVVALSSLSADIVARLAADKLVGIPGNRLLKQNPALANLPRVSEGQTPPNLEKILALKPDLVVGATGFHDQVLARLRAAGVQTLATQVTRWQELENLTRTLATSLQADPQPLLRSYRQFLERKPQNPGSVLVLVSNQPILAPNKTSWAGDLLSQFGVKNLAAELQGQSPQRGYITLSPEKLLAANPDTLILVDVGDGAVDKLRSTPFWKQLKAVQRNRVRVFDYYGLVNPGSLEAIRQACQQLGQL